MATATNCSAIFVEVLKNQRCNFSSAPLYCWLICLCPRFPRKTIKREYYCMKSKILSCLHYLPPRAPFHFFSHLRLLPLFHSAISTQSVRNRFRVMLIYYCWIHGLSWVCVLCNSAAASFPPFCFSFVLSLSHLMKVHSIELRWILCASALPVSIWFWFFLCARLVCLHLWYSSGRRHAKPSPLHSCIEIGEKRWTFFCAR